MMSHAEPGERASQPERTASARVLKLGVLRGRFRNATLWERRNVGKVRTQTEDM